MGTNSRKVIEGILNAVEEVYWREGNVCDNGHMPLVVDVVSEARGAGVATNFSNRHLKSASSS